MRGFQFKKFFVNHSASSMKVGTDAVLLAAVADVAESERILDVGTGCGVIALACAQKSRAIIKGIDIHEPSVTEAAENFRTSNWGHRLQAQCVSFQHFAESGPERYDLIISNPPFFSRSLASPKASRQAARHTEKLSFHDFANASGKILRMEGCVWVILPVQESVLFSTEMLKQGFHTFYELDIIPVQGKLPNRKICGFNRLSSGSSKFQKEVLTIRKTDGSYTREYKNITSDFYLHND